MSRKQKRTVNRRRGYAEVESMELAKRQKTEKAKKWTFNACVGYSLNDDLQIYPLPVLLGQKRFKLYTVEQSKKTTDKEVELFPIKTDAPKDAH